MASDIQNPDFEGLDKLDNLTPKQVESIRQARIEARSIIQTLEPHHIRGWVHLTEILEDSLVTAKQNARLLSPTYAKVVYHSGGGSRNTDPPSPKLWYRRLLSRTVLEVKIFGIFLWHVVRYHNRNSRMLIDDQTHDIVAERW